MKNLMIYINPRKDFDDETRVLAKIQIDNILSLGWKKDNVILVTNFPYKYCGIKASIVGDDCYLGRSTKFKTVRHIFELGMLDKDEVYWIHDFDGYQLEPITETELELGTADMGLTDYGRMPRWSMGSIFFKESAKDIYGWINDEACKRDINEEWALLSLTGSNTHNVNARIKKLNITYNFQRFNLLSCYRLATKPIKNVHFHPTPDKIDIFMHGKNKLNKILLPERLIKIFNRYGIK
jgi:hypothetical protein